MSYLCEITAKISKPGAKLNKIVVATRERTYKEKVFNEETRRSEEIIVGQGHEIVREINACDQGVKIWEAMSPEARTHHLSLSLEARMRACDWTDK